MPLSFEQPSRSKTPNSYAYLYPAVRPPVLPVGQTSRRAHALIPASAAAVRPWPWRNMTGEQRNSTLGKEAKQLLAPTFGHHAMERQQKAQTVWHGITLQDGSITCQSSAHTGAVEAAVAAFKVQSSELLQVTFLSLHNACRLPLVLEQFLDAICPALVTCPLPVFGISYNTCPCRQYPVEPWHLFVQDVFNSLVLAETVYKVQESNHAEVASTVSALRQDFPAPLISLQRLQWSLPHVPHR